MEVFNLLAKLVLDDKDFNTALTTAETKGENFSIKFGDIIKGIGDELNSTNLTAGLNRLSNWFVKSFDNTLKQADAIDKQSQALGISAEMYQKLDYAMSMSGSSVTDLTRGIKNLNEVIIGTASKKISTAFESLVIDTEDANGNLRETGEVLEDVLAALSNMEQTAERDSIVETLFGTGRGQTMKAFLNEGERGINKLMAEAEDLGLVMSDEQIKAAVKAGDERQKLQETLAALTNQVMLPLMPVVSASLEAITPVLASTAPIIQSISNGLVSILQKLGLIEDPNREADIRAALDTATKAAALASGGDYTAFTEASMAGGGEMLDEDAFYSLYNSLIQAADNTEELGDQSGDTADAIESLGAAADSAAEKMANIPAVSGGISDEDMAYAESVFGSHAAGLWSVPQDGYRAVLHRDEMILNASRADDYRNGTGASSDRAIVGAIQRLENTLANLRLMVGEKEFGRATTEYGGRRMNKYIGSADGRIAAGYGS